MRRQATLAVTALAFIVFVFGSHAQAQTLADDPDHQSVEWQLVGFDPSATISHLCSWDAPTQNGTQCAAQHGTTAADGTRTYRQKLPAGLADGDHTLRLQACAPDCAGAVWTFTVKRAGGTTPPPRGIINIRIVADSAPASPAALSAQPKAAASATAPKPEPPAVLVSVPFTELGRARICLHFSDGSPACHNADWWLAQIPTAKRP